MYAHMKNLSAPLPNVTSLSSRSPLLSMPEPGWTARDVTMTSRDDDQESEICSVIADIPPPPAQVKSHALLQESLLGHPHFANPTPPHSAPCPPPPQPPPISRAQKLSLSESHTVSHV